MAIGSNYNNLVAEQSQAHTRLIRNYDGSNPDFDYIIIGSGIGGGILADDLADRRGGDARILVLDVGSFVYPTHVYNISRVPNDSVARHFGVDNFRDWPDDPYYIGERPQMVFGGRSIFWSGLIPQVQAWELAYFPDAVRAELTAESLDTAGSKMNASRSLGEKARALVERFASSDLAEDFVIQETPRALHQPYLLPDGTPSKSFFVEPTGVFNTAELLINQVGLTPGADQNGKGLFIRLNSFVEGVSDTEHGWHEVRVTDTVNKKQLSFFAPKVVIAAGSLESPKLISRSAVYQRLGEAVRRNVGFGLTDHPVSAESQAYVSGMAGSPRIPLARADHAKIVFYSKGRRDSNGHIMFPFNIEMNVNHEYWHLRDNDPTADAVPDESGRCRVDIKFSFANCLDDNNGIFSAPDDDYLPLVRFRRFSDLRELLDVRFPAVAGWRKGEGVFFDLLNATRDRVFSQFEGVEMITGRYGGGPGEQWPFGWGTVHHACGTLRMPWRPNLQTQTFQTDSVVDENLEVRGAPGLYVCDMSVMPISTAANPVRTLAALALRLSKHLTDGGSP